MPKNPDFRAWMRRPPSEGSGGGRGMAGEVAAGEREHGVGEAELDVAGAQRGEAMGEGRPASAGRVTRYQRPPRRTWTRGMAPSSLPPPSLPGGA